MRQLALSRRIGTLFAVNLLCAVASAAGGTYLFMFMEGGFEDENAAIVLLSGGPPLLGALAWGAYAINTGRSSDVAGRVAAAAFVALASPAIGLVLWFFLTFVLALSLYSRAGPNSLLHFLVIASAVVATTAAAAVIWWRSKAMARHLWPAAAGRHGGRRP